MVTEEYYVLRINFHIVKEYKLGYSHNMKNKYYLKSIRIKNILLKIVRHKNTFMYTF